MYEGPLFWIISSYSTFEPEPYDTEDAAHARLGRIMELDPAGFLDGHYWIIPGTP